MFFRIADILVEFDFEREYSNYSPFKVSETNETPVMVLSQGEVRTKPGKQLEEFTNDAGHVVLYEAEGGFLLSVSFDGPVHWMWANKDFSKCVAQITPGDENEFDVLNSMARMAFSQRVLFFEGVSIHSSTVVNGGKAYMFLGTSGTGKSTHSNLWVKALPDTELLNDDNPVIRILGDEINVFGTPWSGKTACYKNASAPVGGIVRLSQAPANTFHEVKGVAAWTTIFPSCSVISRDEILYLQLQHVLNRIVTGIKVGQLACLPDEEAALLCYARVNS